MPTLNPEMLARQRCKHLLPQVSPVVHGLLIREACDDMTDDERRLVEIEIERIYRVGLPRWRAAVASEMRGAGA